MLNKTEMRSQTEYMPIGNIRKNEKNPRFIKDRQFKVLVESIKNNPDFFEARPIICSDRTGKIVILAGHMRYEAAKLLKMAEVPVFVLKDLTEEREKEIMIRDNIQNGEWDFDFPEFAEMATVDDEAEAKEDNYEIPDKVKTDIQHGDLFEIGPHRLLCGDSTNAEDVAKLFNGKLADLIITDPPYNVAYEGKTKDKLNIKNDDMKDDCFFQFLLNFYKAYFTHAKPGAALYVWHADSEGKNFRQAFYESGFDLKQCIIWVKNAMVLGRQDYQWRHEPCLYGWKPGAAHYFINDRSQTTVIDDKINLAKLTKDEMRDLLKEILSDKTPSSVIYHDKPSRNDVHPTMKPVTLIGYQMKNSSKPLQIVADAFLGSGTTMVAAHQLNRRCFGMEFDPIYCAVIIDRMMELDPSLKITKNGEPYTHKPIE